MKIIRRKKIGWVFGEDTIIAFDRLQATTFHMFCYANKKNLDDMKSTILESSQDEYGTWADALELARSFKVKSYSTAVKKEWLNEF